MGTKITPVLVSFSTFTGTKNGTHILGVILYVAGVKNRTQAFNVVPPIVGVK